MSAAILITVLVTAAAAARGTWSPCGLSMISAINPFTERSRGHRYAVTCSWFVLGSLIGGAMLGGVGASGAAMFTALGLHPAVLALLAAISCLVTLAGDAPTSRFALPLIPRQVDERWLGGYRRWVYASGFGLQIGVGLATYVMTGAVFLVPILGALSGSPVFALLGGALFGLIRGLAILLSSRAGSPEKLLDLHRHLAAKELLSSRITMLIQGGAALVFGWACGVPAFVAVAGVLTAGGMSAALQRSRRSTPAAVQDVRRLDPKAVAAP